MKKKTFSILFLLLTLLSYGQEIPKQLSLEEAVTYALENSYATKVAANDVRTAKQKKWETTTIGLPQIEANIDYQKWLKQQVVLLPSEILGGTPGTFEPVLFGTEQTMNAAVTLRQLLFDGSYLIGLQSARTYLKISEQAKEKTAIQTKEAVINAYGNILVTEQTLEILRSNLKILEKSLQDTRKIYENGLTELEDVEQLEITYSTLLNQLNSAVRMKSIAYKMFNIALGIPLDTTILLTDTLDDLTLPKTELFLIQSDFVLDNHIDYRIAANDRESKRLLMKYEQSMALPTLSAFVNYGFNANANDFNFFNSNQEWFQSSLFGVSMKVPVFSSFKRRSKTQQAKIALENADIKLQETSQKLTLQAVKAKSDYQLSIDEYQTAKKNVSLAERIEQKQRVKFFEGLSSSFELTQAQNQLYNQQQQYVQAMLSVITKKAALERALNIPIKN